MIIVYMRKIFGKKISIILYIDDLLIFGTDETHMRGIKSALKRKCRMKDLGPVK